LPVELLRDLAQSTRMVTELRVCDDFIAILNQKGQTIETVLNQVHQKKKDLLDRLVTDETIRGKRMKLFHSHETLETDTDLAYLAYQLSTASTLTIAPDVTSEKISELIRAINERDIYNSEISIDLQGRHYADSPLVSLKSSLRRPGGPIYADHQLDSPYIRIRNKDGEVLSELRPPDDNVDTGHAVNRTCRLINLSARKFNKYYGKDIPTVVEEISQGRDRKILCRGTSLFIRAKEQVGVFASIDGRLKLLASIPPNKPRVLNDVFNPITALCATWINNLNDQDPKARQSEPVHVWIRPDRTVLFRTDSPCPVMILHKTELPIEVATDIISEAVSWLGLGDDVFSQFPVFSGVRFERDLTESKSSVKTYNGETIIFTHVDNTIVSNIKRLDNTLKPIGVIPASQDHLIGLLTHVTALTAQEIRNYVQ